jgi:hypothetical protein
VEGEVSELAGRRMSLDEFLHGDDGTDTRYQLIDGFAAATASEAHRILAMRLGSGIDSAVQDRRPCNVQIDPGAEF